MAHERYLHDTILSDLKARMVFIGGPRQVGKTTLAQDLGQRHFTEFLYFNWDHRGDRKKILSRIYDGDPQMIIFDEIHKYRNWKNHLKGEFDKHKTQYCFLITGSARLDIYRKGGDSLQGRYHYYRLHPFSLSEVLHHHPNIRIFQPLPFQKSNASSQKAFNRLFQYGGFPEPFLSRSPRTLRRFHNERIDRLVKEDIRDIEPIRDLSTLQVLVELLPEKVGSLFSVNALREDLQVTHKTLSKWMDVLERFYYHFRIYPYRAKTIRSLRKEPKMYLWDFSQLSDEAVRLENMIASHLLKCVHFLHDAEGFKAELFFLRDIEKKEVDFLVVVDKKPWFAVEVKWKFKGLPATLKYFSEKLKVPFTYLVVREPGLDFQKDGIRVISADQFLTALY